MTYLGKIGEVINTGNIGNGVSIEWSIPDFLSLDGKSGDFYQSPLFLSASDRGWVLNIYPYGNSLNPPSQWVSLHLFRQGAGPSETLTFKLGIKGAEGVENKIEMSQTFLEDEIASCWIGVCDRFKFKKLESRLMPGNELVIALDIRSDEPSLAINTCTQTEESNVDKVVTDESKCSKNQGGGKALEDFGKLLASGDKSDVTIQLGDVAFDVHSFVLFARSPALSVSLQHQSREEASKKIIVEDCEPDAFREFLHYLYTGSVRSLTDETVFSLHRIADKYLAEDLKQHCLEHIQDTLSVQTFCDSVKLAVTYGESGLLQKAIDFAVKNIRSIVCSVEWQDFIQKYPIEANEIIIKSLGPPCNCKQL